METIKPALGINIKDYDPKVILADKHWRITEKIDGVRRIFFKTAHNKVLAYSRTGKEDIWLEHITSELEAPWFPNNMLYDCELVDRESYFKNEDSFLMRTETNSKASQEYPDNKVDLMAICFDMVHPDGDLTPGKERTLLLQNTFTGLGLHEPIVMVPILGYIYGAHEKILTSLMDMVSNNNGEGLMLMSMDSPYIPGRSKELIKVKRLQEFIGEVIDYEMGREDSKIAGGIAALICRVEGCSQPVRVGTGYSQAMRRDMAEGNIIGTKIEIDAFGKSVDARGETSLSMPVFKSICGL